MATTPCILTVKPDWKIVVRSEEDGLYADIYWRGGDVPDGIVGPCHDGIEVRVNDR